MEIKNTLLSNERNSFFSIKFYFVTKIVLLIIFFLNIHSLIGQEIKLKNNEQFEKQYFLDSKLYNYSKSSDAAINELKFFYRNDIEKLNIALEKVKEIENNQIYFLSNEEYKPIKTKIESIRLYENLPIEEYEMIKNHIKYLNFHFKSIEELKK
jgi:hypothetical protein